MNSLPTRFTSRQTLLVFVAGFACVMVRLHTTYMRAAFPFQVDYEEGNILNAGLRILHGLTPYPAPGSFPYVVNCYGPIGYWLTAAALKVFGLSLFGPRLVILMAGLGTAMLLSMITSHLGGTRDDGMLAGLSFLCAPLVYYWMPTLRVDFLAIFFSLAAIYVWSRSRRMWPIAALLLAVAILTKHTAMAALVAILLELVTQKNTRRAAAFLVLSSSVVAICMAALGRHFVFALLRTHPDPYSWKYALEAYGIGAYGSVLMLAVIAYAIINGFRPTPKSRLAWFYAAACTVTALTAGKLGSNTNHFLEWTASVCLLCGIAIAYLIETNNSLSRPFALAILCLCAIFTATANWSWLQTKAGMRDCARAYDFVHSYPGDRILSENIAAVVVAGKPVIVSNPFVVTQLGDSVDWQAGSIEQLVSRRYFDVVLLGGELKDFRPEAGTWSTTAINAIREGYSPAHEFQCPSASVAYVRNSGTPKVTAMESANASHD